MTCVVKIILNDLSPPFIILIFNMLFIYIFVPIRRGLIPHAR